MPTQLATSGQKMGVNVQISSKEQQQTTNNSEEKRENQHEEAETDADEELDSGSRPLSSNGFRRLISRLSYHRPKIHGTPDLHKTLPRGAGTKEFELRRVRRNEQFLLGGFCNRKQNQSIAADDSSQSDRSSPASVRSLTMQKQRFILAGLNAAVECRDMRISLGLGAFQKTILNDINITVPEGSIYGLLGPSGCGKTTMLRCVIGLIKPQSGKVRVFGYRPNDPGSQIPGPAIGYMPQEISVYETFSIHEMLVYFGKINRMKGDLIEARIEFLLNFLDLPEQNRLVASLSGGQKRRVSLASALVHSPPLLILDEPTVGVDPMLRKSIWNHLVTLARNEKITVIITTHYIEEARQANVVGLMRHGRLLAEDSPDNLMAQYSMSNLEDVFLKLCIDDNSVKKGDDNHSSNDHVLLNMDLPVNNQDKIISFIDDESHKSKIVDLEAGSDIGTADTSDDDSDLTLTAASSSGSGTNRKLVANPARKQSTTFIVNKNNLTSMKPGMKYPPKPLTIFAWFKSLQAVIWKNYLMLKRNPPVLVFEFILPAVQVILFCLCIGGNPFNVPLAVVNEDHGSLAGKFFLNAIDEDTILQKPFDNLTSALDSVRRGEVWGAIHIPERYTQNLQERLLHPSEVTNDTLKNGTIYLYPDLTNLHLSLAMEATFREAFIKFSKDMLNLLGYDPDMAEMPIRVAEPIYGTLKREGFLEFMAPGVVISITYVMATGLTALAFILEKRGGLLERCQVSGVTTSQLLLAHAAVQVIVMLMQIGLVLVVTFFVFEVPSNGPFAWAVVLILLQGCTGMAYGLLVSAVCNEETTAVMMLVGTFYTNLILAGIIWPLEAMPHWLRLASYLQPQTQPIESLRNILSRGWGIEEVGVYMGFVVTIGWLLMFLFAAGLCMRYLK